MKKTLLLCLAGMLGFSAPISAKKNAELLKSFRVFVWDNNSMGKIDAERGTILVKHIPDGASVTSAKFEVEPGTQISPDPQTLVGKWPEEVTFTLKKGRTTEKYTVVMADYVKDPAPDTWKLIWNDEFNDGAIDYDAWSKTPRGQGNWHDMMSDADDLYTFDDGALVLWGKPNPDTSVDPSPYITGGIWGRDKKAFHLGRADIRAKVDNGKGFWPALWFLPQGNDAPHSAGGEIDLIEHLNSDGFVYQTVHTPYTNLVSRINPSNHVKSPFVAGEFNTYSVIVEEDKVIFLTNNEVMYEYPNLHVEGRDQFPFPFSDYYFILSNQLGGNWVGEVGIDGPVRLMVDYVRVYQKR